ncbi:MAG: hypothetical protein C5B49_14040 [Bdellovibrio sp.]|nr:MAG: hypothetical protein C5B49_14040 [Bdellovibrio sp.]
MDGEGQHLCPRATCTVELKKAPSSKSRAPASVDSQACTFSVRLEFKDHAENRVYSCQIPPGENSCTTALTGLGIGRPTSVKPAELNKTPSLADCMYDEGSPSGQVSDDKPGEILVRHAFACSNR